MDLDEEIRKLKKRGPERPIALSKMAKITAATLDRAANDWCHKIFWDKKFRKLAEFDKMDKAEWDRIFNELVLAPLTLIMITLEAPDLRQQDLRDYLRMVKDEIPWAHLDCLRQLGIEKRYLADWKKLIQMRYEEYSDGKLSAREAMMIDESRKGKLTPAGMDHIQLFLPPFTVAVGCHTHICRGKTKGKNRLYKYMIKHLTRFYTQIRILIEGGELTPALKFRMSMRHFINDIKDDLKDRQRSK